MGCVFLRALAANDDREEIKGTDYLAEKFLPENYKTILNNPVSRKQLMKKPPIMYAYLIARTSFFDRIIEQTLLENIPQIVFLGAGYDGRPYRFKNKIKKTRIFELDIHPTQQHKKKLLQQANISIPQM